MSNVLSSPLQKARAIKDATVCVRRMGTSRKFGGDMFSPSRNSRQNVASGYSISNLNDDDEK
ncbi:hypothetical protein ABHI18_010171 [Aspergillus niger]